MKQLIIPALLVSLFAVHSAHAGGGYDLQCLLENGEQMTLSHASDTVYISFEKPGGDSEESGSVIKLDIPSGEAKQTVIAKSEAGIASFTLRGESEDIDGSIAVNYSEYDGTGDAHYTVMNSLGQETSTVSCKPGTINVSWSLLQYGINGAGSQQANKPAPSQQQQAQQPKTPPFKVQFGSAVSNEGWNTRYGVIQLTITDDNMVLKSIRVNRGNCKMESVGNRTLPAKYKFGDVATFKYMKCDRIIEATIVTNSGSWTFNN
ncbi:hypothetical protein [Klebsiella quasipneumoniae]|jgi:hypothetical protein|uniref:hypothetical protein n=1 Tax=Klebsiella quasipneumoniae TaxID=1463165 RepID=UPI00352AB81E